MNTIEDSTDTVSAQDEQSQLMCEYFGDGIVSINLSGLSITSHSEDSFISCEKHTTCSEICHSPIPNIGVGDLDESYLSTILYDSAMMEDILEDSWTSCQMCSILQEPDVNSQLCMQKCPGHETALAQLDAICDWLQNEPTFYAAPITRFKDSHINHHVYAKCSMSSLPQNMRDSVCDFKDSLKYSTRINRATKDALFLQTGVSPRRPGHSVMHALKKKMRRFAQMFRK